MLCTDAVEKVTSKSREPLMLRSGIDTELQLATNHLVETNKEAAEAGDSKPFGWFGQLIFRVSGRFFNVHFKFPLLAAAAGPSPLAAASKQRCVTLINRRGDWP